MQDLFSIVEGRIDDILETHAPKATRIAEFGFKRLPRYYPPGWLNRTWAVIVENCPFPEVDDLDIEGILDMRTLNPIGITYKDTYFVKNGYERDESLHFHELIHVIQWSHFSPAELLNMYVDGLEQYGYRSSPLEEQAYRHQSYFDRGVKPYDVAEAVKKELDAWQA